MKNLKFILLIVTIFSLPFVYSCKSNPGKTDKDTAPKKDTVQKKEKEPEVKNSVLEGTWISTEDSKSALQVKGNDWTEIYEGEKPDTFKFGFGDSCLANQNAKTNPSGKYITVFDVDGNRCFYIVSVSDSKLELSYVGRGNTLKYIKKK
ncbi:MAG: hypothetical protein PHN88_00300 [Ignavibacteria bacterium]|nr:hypothetical protein [Ignavibacteria bacterium]